MHQFIDDIPEPFGHGFTHFGPGILGRQHLRQAHQAAQRRFPPRFRQGLFPLHQIHFFLRVINQRQQVLLLLLRQRVAEELFHLLADDAGAIVQNMQERVILAVQVAHEMLRPLRQVEDGLQVDDFREDRRLVGELAGQYIEILQLFVRKLALFHVVHRGARGATASFHLFPYMLFVIIVHQSGGDCNFRIIHSVLPLPGQQKTCPQQADRFRSACGTPIVIFYFPAPVSACRTGIGNRCFPDRTAGT